MRGQWGVILEFFIFTLSKTFPLHLGKLNNFKFANLAFEFPILGVIGHVYSGIINFILNQKTLSFSRELDMYMLDLANRRLSRGRGLHWVVMRTDGNVNAVRNLHSPLLTELIVFQSLDGRGSL